MAVPFEMDGAAAAWQREGVDMTQENLNNDGRAERRRDRAPWRGLQGVSGAAPGYAESPRKNQEKQWFYIVIKWWKIQVIMV